MKDDVTLTQDQQSRISRTLARIREGLARFSATEPPEPAPTFKPEAFDDQPR
ncbi:MAG TPA: hypothetical protein PLI43_10390 [Albidovulum sp.]|uniref:hypothetical protein n=1 Tax=Albidovulum sp. TaxID=1872424 RepID=UPI002BE76AC3|nr:hypothetical protein [Albidovulum sp.]